ncbi:hypothetical protein HUW46_09327 [Amycolatopsis sp. CA-230715]|nr:hypothetical protein HUW46_09327 [Amycolatopsis sp. CA-230715]
MVRFQIELVGGDAHQHRLVINGDPMDPPETFEMCQEPSARELDPKTPLPPGRRLLYRRGENNAQGNNGPLWFYRFESELPV